MDNNEATSTLGLLAKMNNTIDAQARYITELETRLAPFLQAEMAEKGEQDPEAAPQPEDSQSDATT